MNSAYTDLSAVFFLCPACTHTLRVEASMGGLRTDCPNCASPVNAPLVSERSLEDVPLQMLPPGLRTGR